MEVEGTVTKEIADDCLEPSEAELLLTVNMVPGTAGGPARVRKLVDKG